MKEANTWLMVTAAKERYYAAWGWETPRGHCQGCRQESERGFLGVGAGNRGKFYCPDCFLKEQASEGEG